MPKIRYTFQYSTKSKNMPKICYTFQYLTKSKNMPKIYGIRFDTQLKVKTCRKYVTRFNT